MLNYDSVSAVHLAFRSHSSFCSSSGRKECGTSFSFWMGTFPGIHHSLDRQLPLPQLWVLLPLQQAETGVLDFPLQVTQSGLWSDLRHIYLPLPPFRRLGS